MYKIIDNFLEEKDFKQLKDFMFCSNMPWFYANELNHNQTDKTLHSYFTFKMKELVLQIVLIK